MLGKLSRLDARTVWKSEPYDFTPWLREHTHLLSEALGIELEIDVGREVAVGPFSADLVGTDLGSSARVVIENQLEQSDHSHLGQLLTYAGGLDVGFLIWVTTKMRDEHRQALTWLNERTQEGVACFGVEIELLSIDGSKPAPHFKIVVAPNEWQKATASAAAPTSERRERYKVFWRGLLGDLLALDRSATSASPERVGGQNWYGISIGRSGFATNFCFGYEGSTQLARIELYIDVGSKEENEAMFDLLEADRETIEREFGEKLVWDRREDIRACRIYVHRPGSIDNEGQQLDELREWGVPRMLALRRVFGHRVKALPSQAASS